MHFINHTVYFQLSSMIVSKIEPNDERKDGVSTSVASTANMEMLRSLAMKG
jgi:hypothetical protein